MMFNQLAHQMKKITSSRADKIQRNRTMNLIIGAGIGSVAGVAAGILFAPKSGRETRHIIADRTGQTVKNLKDNAAATKEKIVASAKEYKEKSSE